MCSTERTTVRTLYGIGAIVPGRDGWVNFAVRPKGSEAKKFCLAWNGSRFARSSELELLAERFPFLLEEVTAWLEVEHP